MEPERISFPADYPIKVVARAAPDLRSRVDGVFSRHFGAAATQNVTERASGGSNFVSLTYVPRVEAESQLSALHEDLRQLPGVIMVL